MASFQSEFILLNEINNCRLAFIFFIQFVYTLYMTLNRVLKTVIRTERGRLITVIIAVHVIVLFYVVMYALFVLSVHVYYVNCNAKTQMGYLCTIIK